MITFIKPFLHRAEIFLTFVSIVSKTNRSGNWMTFIEAYLKKLNK